ncbi:hypothetical protein A3Q36_10525 [Geobacillus stearothermophilus]|nr:hypothetical protein A3Q36_10525 [Geobacillus stearothermophilus]
MLAMPEINRIRKLREKKGLSIAEISRETGYNWRTVKKYADEDISVQPTIKCKLAHYFRITFSNYFRCILK